MNTWTDDLDEKFPLIKKEFYRYNQNHNDFLLFIESLLKEQREKTLIIVSEIQKVAMRYNTVVSTEAIHLEIKEIVLKHLTEPSGVK